MQYLQSGSMKKILVFIHFRKTWKAYREKMVFSLSILSIKKTLYLSMFFLEIPARMKLGRKFYLELLQNVRDIQFTFQRSKYVRIRYLTLVSCISTATLALKMRSQSGRHLEQRPGKYYLSAALSDSALILLLKFNINQERQSVFEQKNYTFHM